MSRLDNAAKQFVEPMLLGRSITLDSQAIRTVTAWVTLKMMVFEVIDPTEAVFTRDETLAFAQTQASPPDVQIWLFKTASTPLLAYISRAFAGMSHGTPTVTKKANVGVTVFVVGRLVVLFVVNRVGPLKFNEPPGRRSKRLWPTPTTQVRWPPLATITDEKIAEMARALGDFVRSRGIMI